MKNNPAIIIIIAVILFSIAGCKKETAVIQDNLVSIDTTLVSQNVKDTLASFDNLKLTEYDTPPSPIVNPMPEYPAEFKNTGIQGVVVLEVIVLQDGTVSNVRVMKSLLAAAGGLDEAAISAVKQWKFKPALLNKKPVQARVTIPIPFSLRSGS